MIPEKYLIVGNARIGATSFDWGAALQALLNAGLNYATAVAQANAQQKAFEAAQAKAAADAAAGAGGSGSQAIMQYLPYIAIGTVLVVLLLRKK